jgi:NADH-quinone oxidoreductase subunit F
MLNILERICNGNGKPEDISLLQELSDQIKAGSLCGLGQTAPNPVLTTLRYFKDEYEEHIIKHRCPARVCKALVSYQILPDKCQGCGICMKNCPSQAISGGKRLVHAISQSKCTKCGTCLEVCPSKFNAVILVSGGLNNVSNAPIEAVTKA